MLVGHVVRLNGLLAHNSNFCVNYRRGPIVDKSCQLQHFEPKMGGTVARRKFPAGAEERD